MNFENEEMRQVESRERYRPDIDGLRAIAVMSVVLFHAGFRYTTGGFVGVDVFFVISGFLITGHIFRELQSRTFTFVNFYERRIRRIAPALLVMMMLVLIYAFVTLLPEELLTTAESGIASTLSVSNFYFWQTTDYWHGGDKVFLHTWSLSIEEQFYLLMPFLLTFIVKWPRALWTATLWGLFGASFLVMLTTYSAWPSAAFYLLPQRAWELLLGGLFGLGLVSFPSSRLGREIIACLSLFVICAIIVQPPQWQAPVPATILACVASAVMLAAGIQGPTFAGKALSVTPMRWIGLASYSIYLWHEPIIFFNAHSTEFVYGKILSPILSPAQAVTIERLIFIVCASLLAGFLSWRFVERPFRTGALKPSRNTLFRLAGFSAVAFVAAGVAVIAGAGFPERFSARVIKVAKEPDLDQRFKDGVCFPNSFPENAAGICKPLVQDRPNWLLIGDSLAGRLDYGLHLTFPQVNLVEFTKHGCHPLPVGHFGETAECLAGYQKFYNDFLPKHHVDLVIMAANWQAYDVPRIERAISIFHRLGQPVVLVGPNMQYDMPMRLLLADSIRQNDATLPSRHRVTGYDDLDRTMSVLARDKWNIRYFTYAPFCPNGHCVEWAAKDVPFIFDTVHMSDEASVIVAKKMKDVTFLP